MKSFKKVITAALIVLIVASVAGIIYVTQLKEEPPGSKEPKKAEKSAVKKLKIKDQRKIVSPKPSPSRQVAIIIDDIGYDLKVAKEFMAIDADLTFSILPFQPYSREAAEMLYKAKRETLLHLPMEPLSYPREKPGEGALFTDMNDDEITFQLKRNIEAVPYIVGVNNHMGSKFMSDEQKLVLVFKELKKNKLFFVDSKTSPDTKTMAAARKTDLKVAERKIFIDHQRDYDAIYAVLIGIAQSDDASPKIVIGHPYPETVRAIRDAVKVFRKRGITVVPASKIIKEQNRSS